MTPCRNSPTKLVVSASPTSSCVSGRAIVIRLLRKPLHCPSSAYYYPSGGGELICAPGAQLPIPRVLATRRAVQEERIISASLWGAAFAERDVGVVGYLLRRLLLHVVPSVGRASGELWWCGTNWKRPWSALALRDLRLLELQSLRRPFSFLFLTTLYMGRRRRLRERRRVDRSLPFSWSPTSTRARRPFSRVTDDGRVRSR